MNRLGLIALAALCLAPGQLPAALTPAQIALLPAPARHQIDFAKEIQPLLENACIKCHARGKEKGGLRLDTRVELLQGGDSGPAVVPGSSAGSYLIELVSGLDPDNVMPQKGSKLSPQQVGLLRAWIDQGVRWDEHISFGKAEPRNLKPHAPPLPATSKAASQNPVDRWLDPYFAMKKVAAGQPVADRGFARRVYLDVIGLPPSPPEMEAFLADPRPDKRERLVQQLLGDNHRYAQHWLTFWNDRLRNDYRGTGYIDGGRKQITTWLYSALATNLPYDRFVAELVNPAPAAEGFIKGIVWRGVVNASMTPEMQAAQNISQVFMGVNLKCASCHDSFINDWALADAYGLASIYAEQPLEMVECDKPTGKIAPRRFIYPELGEFDPAADRPARLRRLAEILTARENGRLSRTIVNRLWARFMGRGLVEPLDDMEQPAWHPELLDWLAEDLVAHGYDLKHTMARILTSRAYQLPAVDLPEQMEAGFVFHGPGLRRLTAEQFRDALGALTGVFFARAAGDVDFTLGTAAAGHLQAANPKWIWNQPNAASDAPAGAVYFRRTFTLSVRPTEALVLAAADNSYTLYVNGTRVGGGKSFQTPEAINVLPQLRAGENVFAVEAVNGRGPGPNPAGFILHALIRHGEQAFDFSSDSSWTFARRKPDGWETVEFKAADWQPASELGGADIAPWQISGAFARALGAAAQQGQIRASLVTADPLMLALGRPNREQVITARAMTATTLQALELTNGDTLAQLVEQGAQKLLAGGAPGGSALVEQLFRRGLGRPPTETERRLSEELLGAPVQKEGVEDLLWSLAMLPEFQLIY